MDFGNINQIREQSERIGFTKGKVSGEKQIISDLYDMCQKLNNGDITEKEFIENTTEYISSKYNK